MNEYLYWWLMAAIAAALGALGRIGVFLFGPKSIDPPNDPTLRAHWHRRRKWFGLSELMAIPAIASLATLLSRDDLEQSPLTALWLTLIGFMLFMEGLQTRFKRLFGIKDEHHE